jgi:hypothetical protein
MLKDKKGLSAIVLTVIMVGLVLVAVGIVWVVVSNILEGQTEALDYDQKCLGLNFDVGAPTCDGVSCDVIIERATGSKGDAIDGVAVTLSSATDSTNETLSEGNIAASKTVSVDEPDFSPTRADVRVYFEKEDGTNHYCSTIFGSEETSEEGGAVM